MQLGCKGLRLKAKDADQIDYCHLGKMAVVKGLHQKQSTCGLSIRTATGQCGLQHLHGVLPRLSPNIAAIWKCIRLSRTNREISGGTADSGTETEEARSMASRLSRDSPGQYLRI